VSLRLWQIGIGLGFLAIWEAAALFFGAAWISSPLLVGARLGGWLAHDLYLNVLTTLWEMIAGLLIGAGGGIVLGLALGRMRRLAEILRPLVYAVYSVPLIALAPLFIMFFGLGMLPKIVLVALVVFFLLFFNTLAGAQSVDEDLVDAMKLMGATRWEEFRTVIVPGCAAWIVTGLKTALPYALVAATTGEMLAARQGMGFLLSDAAQKFDITSLYAALFVLVLLGLLVAEAAIRLENWLLAWRHVAE
jgi:NitT/TauT family transport system permease protein